jgi:ribonuclease HI
MPWRAALLRGNRVLARCDERGNLVADGGRVEIRYKPADGKAYRAALGNLQLEANGEVHPDAYCAEAGPVDVNAAKAAKASKSASAGGSKSRSASVGTGAAPTSHGDIFAYTDGACSGNPGPAGLGVVLVTPEGRRELSEYLGTATNNIAELTAILRALEALGESAEPVAVHTDSQYAIGVLQKGWKAKANQELIAGIKQAMRPFKKLSLVYVRGHAGVPLNERCDELARQAVTRRASAGWQEVKVRGPNG